MSGRGGAPKEQRHAGAVVDLDAHRTGHTIPASAAEAAGQLSAVCFYKVLKLRRHNRWIVNVA